MKNNLQLAKNAQYEWNPNFRLPISHTDIKLILKELRYIEENNGELTPAMLVEASRDTRSVLHQYFEWNNQKAADSWRMQQARMLLGNIQVKVVKEGKPIRMQAYQVTKVPFAKASETTYTKFNALTEDNLLYIKQVALRDLVRIKNKLEANDLDAAVPYLEKAIRLIQKEAEVITIK